MSRVARLAAPWLVAECLQLRAGGHEAGGDEAHPAVLELTDPDTGDYAFQKVRTDTGILTDVVLVKAPMLSPKSKELFEKYKDEVLFLGISSYGNFPLTPTDPYINWKEDFTDSFPGFLNMFRNPEQIYPASVKTVLLSQSDFSLPNVDLSTGVDKTYDFIMVGTDQDVANDCQGWSSYAKNWTMAKDGFDIMCQAGLKGVVVGAKRDGKTCTMPESCADLVTVTEFLPQDQLFSLMKQSSFQFVPNTHDASPRAAAQGLAHNLPLLMNYHLIGGWKYLNEKTGEFFHDASDFKQALDKMLVNVEAGNKYESRKYVLENLGDSIAGLKFKDFVENNFADRVTLPEGTKYLMPN